MAAEMNGASTRFDEPSKNEGRKEPQANDEQRSPPSQARSQSQSQFSSPTALARAAREIELAADVNGVRPKILQDEHLVSLDLGPRAVFSSFDVDTEKALARRDAQPRAPRTKIVCTVGPACASREVLEQMLEAGMNVVRLNFSHGDHEYHLRSIRNARAVATDSRRILAILLDTKGPEIRSGKIKRGEVLLKKGQDFVLTTDPAHADDGDETRVFVAYPNITKVLQPGQKCLIDDGLISLTVKSTTEKELHCVVENNGVLGSTKGINLPGSTIDLPAVTEKDLADINFGVDNGVDFIAASFVRKPQDVRDIRKVLDAHPSGKGKSVQIISKIENQEGLDNFEQILAESDGIMVARGDLGVEIPIENVSLAQKRMIASCNREGKFVITATQMLESMIKNPSPTRAEASDVANAIIDGSDCVMFSGETAKGAYPVAAVRMMADISRECEEHLDNSDLLQRFRPRLDENSPFTEAICAAAVQTSYDLRASIIIVFSATGHTARLLSKYRPSANILVVTDQDVSARQCLTSSGTFPLLVGSMRGLETLIPRVTEAALKLSLAKVGDTAIVVCGTNLGLPGSTNMLRVVTVE